MIRVCDISTQAGDFRLDDISLALSAGEYGVLMGKTGAGKTTLLECICGLRPIVRGTIELASEDVTNRRPAERGIGYVPQDGALFPKMTVRDNLAFPLIVRKWNRSDIDARTNELAAKLGIASLLSRHPAGLSGGECQRVALGRALAFRPSVLLLDEPLSALDEETRISLYDVLNRVRQDSKVTTLHVTHNRTDALQLADKVFQLLDGKVLIDCDKGEFPSKLVGQECAAP